MHKAVHRIEPKVAKLVETANLLTTPRDANYDGASNMKNDPVDLLGGIAQDLETPDWHKASHEQSASSLTDPRPSILYDVLEYRDANHVDRIPDLHSVDQKHTERVSENERLHHHANGAMDNDGPFTHQSVVQSAYQVHKDDDTWLGLDQFDKPGPGLGKCIGKVFQDENLLKLVTDSEPSRYMEKEMPEDTLIDIVPGTDRSPKSNSMNGGLARPDKTNTGQTQALEKAVRSPASKIGVNENPNVTSVDPILGVEQVNRDFCLSDKRSWY